MGTLDEQLAIDATSFVDVDAFGEPVTYTPNGGSPVVINATVLRGQPSQISEAPRGLAPFLEIQIANHATLGVTSVDTGVDKVTVARRVGQTPVALTVAEVINHDAGMWHLRLR